MTDILYTETLTPWWSTAIATALAIAVIPIATTSIPAAGAMLAGAAISFWFGRARYVVSADRSGRAGRVRMAASGDRGCRSQRCRRRAVDLVSRGRLGLPG
jgi:hypothetical protein